MAANKTNRHNSATSQQMFNILKKALWNKGTAHADEATYEEMKKHAIAALATPVLPELNLSEELYNTWRKNCILSFTRYQQCLFIQTSLPITLPYAILKGTSAAQYYPCPENRSMGDIDLMTRREDCQAVCNILIENGFVDITDPNNIRHRELRKNNIIVEVHSYFAQLNDAKQAEYLDNLIIDNIKPSHILPDMVNGLVLLEHISQHLENGLGLRQIIDWMMFVNKCLPDEKWPEFQLMAIKIGLEKLAVITTRMCEIYLGLPKREWCSEANYDYCEKLMKYILSSGNFGNKLTEESDYSISTIVEARTVKNTIRMLHQRGMINWEAAQKHAILRPFAAIYQIWRYIIKSFKRSNSVSKLKDEYDIAKERKALFDVLGVRQRSLGQIVYKNGSYERE